MKIAVLIPTIFRPQGLVRVLSSLQMTAPECLPVIAAEKDDIQAMQIAHEFRAIFVHCKEPLQGPGYAYNAALAAAPLSDAYFLASDDVEFMEGWLEEVLFVLATQLNGSGFVGINDTRKDPERIKSGKVFPTHYLMTRDYIVRYNGGVAAYNYPVDWTDIEANLRAKLSGQWAYAEKAIVKHHWIGTNNPDEHFHRNQTKKNEAKAMYMKREADKFPDDLEAILK